MLVNPSAHLSHLVAPTLALNHPTAQASHANIPLFACAVPFGQAKQTLPPRTPKLPVPHTTHLPRTIPRATSLPSPRAPLAQTHRPSTRTAAPAQGKQRRDTPPALTSLKAQAVQIFRPASYRSLELQRSQIVSSRGRHVAQLLLLTANVPAAHRFALHPTTNPSIVCTAFSPRAHNVRRDTHAFRTAPPSNRNEAPINPFPHFTHLAAPFSTAANRKAHSLHSVIPSLGAKLPASHLVHRPSYAAFTLPFLHSTHPSCPSTRRCVPGGHTHPFSPATAGRSHRSHRFAKPPSLACPSAHGTHSPRATSYRCA